MAPCIFADRLQNPVARLVARSHVLPDAADALCAPVPVGAVRQLATLTTRELAGLWHVVQAADDVALVERTTARRFLPLPETVADRAGHGLGSVAGPRRSSDQGRRVGAE